MESYRSRRHGNLRVRSQSPTVRSHSPIGCSHSPIGCSHSPIGQGQRPVAQAQRPKSGKSLLGRTPAPCYLQQQLRTVTPPPVILGHCPICSEPITTHEDVLTLGCRSRSAGSTPHQIHCTPCAHEWLRATPTPVQCPICRDVRLPLNTMQPGGTYVPHGCVLVLTWPTDSAIS